MRLLQLPRDHSLYPVWNRALVALIHTTSASSEETRTRTRTLVAVAMRAFRAYGSRKELDTLRGHVAWTGYPVSDAFLRNRYDPGPIRRECIYCGDAGCYGECGGKN